MTNENKLWNYLLKEINNPYGVAGLMGNLMAESALLPNNLQNSYEKRLGYNDETYSAAVNNGTYSRAQFIYDGAGYGLAQWTHWSRKASLYDYTKRAGAEIDGLYNQAGFLVEELRGYKLLDKLATATNIKDASDLILTQYERPADQSESAKQRRAKLGSEIYTRNATSTPAKSPDRLKLEEIKALLDTYLA